MLVGIQGEPEVPGGRPRLMLCDFGLSKDELADSICKTVCGTPEYVAPEILLYSHYDGKVKSKSLQSFLLGLLDPWNHCRNPK